MFSGSVSKSLNTSESYDGVGLELVIQVKIHQVVDF